MAGLVPVVHVPLAQAPQGKTRIPAITTDAFRNMMAASLAQKNLRATSALVLMFLAACSAQLVVSSCGGMMGELRSERTRRTAGSFYQGGSLGFGALAALVLIPLSDAGRPGLLGLAAGAMIALPALAAFAAPKQETAADETFLATLRRMGRGTDVDPTCSIRKARSPRAV